MKIAHRACLLVLTGWGHAHAQALPAEVVRQLPAGYQVLAQSQGDLTGDGLPDYLVALARPDEAKLDPPPKRPLLIFVARRGGGYALAGRNDAVVANLAEAGQCDPFTSSSDSLAQNGRYFTVENAAACGSHWSDYVTFRYDPGTRGFLFWKEIAQDWRSNPDPDGEALVKDLDSVRRADPKRPVTFSQYRSP